MGPVYVLTDDGRAAIVGMFNSTWGQFPAAVSWQSIDQQIRGKRLRDRIRQRHRLASPFCLRHKRA